MRYVFPAGDPKPRFFSQPFVNEGTRYGVFLLTSPVGPPDRLQEAGSTNSLARPSVSRTLPISRVYYLLDSITAAASAEFSFERSRDRQCRGDKLDLLPPF
jgi:hypothetical protein